MNFKQFHSTHTQTDNEIQIMKRRFSDVSDFGFREQHCYRKNGGKITNVHIFSPNVTFFLEKSRISENSDIGKSIQIIRQNHPEINSALIANYYMISFLHSPL